MAKFVEISICSNVDVSGWFYKDVLFDAFSDGSRSLVPSSDASFVRLAFKVGGQKLFADKLREAVSRKIWDTRVRSI